MNTLYPPQILANTATLYPLRKMITCGKRTYTYQESWRAVKRLAYELSLLNVKGKVLVSMPNSPEFIFTIFAIFKIGAIPIPANPSYTSYELNDIIHHSGASVLATREDNSVCFRFFDSPRTHKYITDELLTDSDPLSFEMKFTPSKKAIIFYTSGSTGKMKGVVHTFTSLCANPYSLADLMNIRSDDIYFIGVPLFHLFGFSPGMLTAIIKGAEITISDMIGSLCVLDRIHNQKATVFLCNATMLKQLLSLCDRRTYDTSSLRIVMVSGSISPKKLLQASIKKICRNTLNLYGATETGIMAQTLPDDCISHLTSTVGKPLPSVKIRILDDKKKRVARGNVGEISCKTYGIFKEYHKMPSSTAKAKNPGGWYSTGDMGRMDANGYIHLVGRKCEMILKSGFNIYPREVELVLLQHNRIKDAAVVGVPDPIYGEVIRAVIIKNEKEHLTELDILDHCRSRLVYYKTPDQIIFVRDFPITSTGKVCKNDLRKLPYN